MNETTARNAGMKSLSKISPDTIKKRRSENLSGYIAGLEPKMKGALDEVPSEFKFLSAKVWSGNATPRERIKLKCLDCSAYQRHEITNCPVKQCGLWALRPFRPKT